MKRAIRRAHYRRRIKKFSAISYNWWSSQGDEWKFEWTRKMATTSKPCSCHMCRNIKRQTMQEYKSKLAEQEGREDAGLTSYRLRRGHFD